VANRPGDEISVGDIRSVEAARLSEIACATAPFQVPPVDQAGARFVTPLLVGRVEYREYTRQLRHAAWKGIAAVHPTSTHLPIQL
jgi:hypothetical protein